MNDDLNLSDLLDLEVKRQEEAAEKERLEAEVEGLTKKYQERPDWWTVNDLMLDTSVAKPEGFLANDEMFQRETVNIVFGPGGVYKTFLMMHFIECAALGTSFAGLPTRIGRSLFLSEEMTRPQVTRRVKRLYGPENRDKVGDMIAYRFHDPDAPFDFYKESKLSKARLTRYISTTNTPDIVVIDALVDVMTARENDSSEVGQTLRAIRDVAIKTGTCIIIVDHSGKESEFRKGKDRVRGASVKRDICADMLLVDSIGSPQKPKSSAEWVKHRDLSIPVYPFNFSLESDSHNSDQITVTFDINPASISEGAVKANAEKLAVIVSDMATALDLPVSKDDLRKRMCEVVGWSRRRFDEVLAFSVSTGIIEKSKEGKTPYFSIPTPSKEG